MKPKYENENEITGLVAAFECASIPREEWRHAEHLVVGLYYVTHHDIATAAARMRSGIFKLLRDGFAVDLEKEMPYHETLTLFWIRTIADFKASRGSASLVSKANELVAAYDKDYPLRFYSRELLFSEKARSGYVPADLAHPPFETAQASR